MRQQVVQGLWLRYGRLVLLVGLMGCRTLTDVPPPPEPPQNGLRLYYRFDAQTGGVYVDETGAGVAIQNGGVSWVAEGLRGGAVAFDGAEHSFIEDTDGGTVFNGLSAVTLSIWVKSNEMGTDAGFLICEPPSGHDRALTLRYDAEGGRSGGTNIIKGGVTIEEGEQTNFESVSNIQTTDWQHLVMTWASGDGFQLYTNGVRVSLHLRPAREGTLSGMSTLLIGKGAKDANSSWNGLIDELLIYDRVLTPEEVLALFELGMPL